MPRRDRPRPPLSPPLSRLRLPGAAPLPATAERRRRLAALLLVVAAILATPFVLMATIAGARQRRS